MNLIELYINNTSMDLDDASIIQLNKVVSELRDPLKKTGTVSLPLVLPYTQKNRTAFFGEDDRQMLGKFRRLYDARLVVNNQTLLDGQWKQVKNSTKGFEGGFGEVKIGNPKIGDVLSDKKLTDIKSFAPVAFSGSSSVGDSWVNTVAFPDAEICFPWVSRSLSDFNNMGAFTLFQRGFSTTYEDLGISHFIGAILTNIFKDAGYAVDGEIFGNPTFQKMILLYSSSAKQLWNYGALAPMRSECNIPAFSLGGYWEGGVLDVIERDTDFIHVFTYPFRATQGDLCSSLGFDGVYTCKFSGNYTMQVRGDAQASIGNYPAFTAFRNITDDGTIPTNLIGSSSAFSTLTPEYLDNGTIAVGNFSGNTDMNFVARLEEGKQYALQRYISVPKTVANAGTMFFYNPNSGKFHISLVDGPMTVNPAAFLPDMNQSEFVNAIFKIFNLYYQLNQEEKTITLLTRDTFFQETLNDLVDLTPYLNLDLMDEFPLTDKEIAQTYLSYATDDADYILKQTDYMSLVNGEQPDEATKLPFAPLGFMRVTYRIPDGNGGTTTNDGEDFIPAILPTQESEDTSVLADVDNATTGGSWVPRIALYQGNNWLKAIQVQTPLGTTIDYPVSVVGVGRFYPPTGNIVIGGVTPGYYEYSGAAPKLSFFDYASQPTYKITTNTALRSYAVELATTPTIYDAGGDPDFLQDVTRVPELNATSLATNTDGYQNPRGFFYQLYSNDLLIATLSNYFEGVGRMNPTLFTRLNGRQVLRLDNDLFLLESLKNYDITKGLCTYRLYKLVANTSNVTVASTRYTSTQSYTASCASGYTGNDVTATATRTSFISQANADAAALAAATTAAMGQLVCNIILPEFTATASFTASCGFGYHGPDYTATVSYTSNISQADAQQHAELNAETEAYANLSCDRDPDPE